MMENAAGSWLSTWWLRKAMATTKPFARGMLLDVGCGAAPYRGFYDVEHHVAVDWPNTLHDRRHIDAYASADALPFADRSFDTVLCTEVLEHLRQPEMAIAEASRVLRPGGHLIVSVPFLYGIHEQPFDFFRYTENGLQWLFEKHGLPLVHLVRRGGSIAVATDLLGKVTYRVGRSTLTSLKVPARARAWILRSLVEPPQRVVAHGASVAERVFPRGSALVGAERVATLGYVVVGRRE